MSRDSRGNIRYKRSRIPRRLHPSRRIMDDMTGAWTTEDRLVTTHFGERTDPRFRQIDSTDYRR